MNKVNYKNGKLAILLIALLIFMLVITTSITLLLSKQTVNLESLSLKNIIVK